MCNDDNYEELYTSGTPLQSKYDSTIYSRYYHWKIGELKEFKQNNLLIKGAVVLKYMKHKDCISFIHDINDRISAIVAEMEESDKNYENRSD